MPQNSVFFTRTGDDGTTAIYGQTARLPKHHPRPEAYGSIDEAQAVLGILRAASHQPRVKEIIIQVERDLYLMMGQLATADSGQPGSRIINQQNVDWLEQVTEELGSQTGMLSNFVLPGDTFSGAYAHLARTVIRRAERRVSHLLQTDGLTNPHILPYLNRLSSLLFFTALFEDTNGGVESPTYAKK